jgi:hypothetical protein
MKQYKYELHGYESYFNFYDDIQKILLMGTRDIDENLLLALNEAVNNAATYSVSGLEQAKIEILIRMDNTSLEIKVSSDTNPFDAYKYKQHLQEVLSSLNTAKSKKALHWGEYTKNMEHGRGIWYMLSACDYLLFDSQGKFVVLHAPIPFRPESYSDMMDRLIYRFFIIDKGVIS